ncbi:hypothetical protein EHS43_07235, partial [Streptomyces sp. RP5T]
GWAASRHRAAGGARVVGAVLARGAVEVRAFLVTGAEPGTPVRVTGWAPRDGVHSELLPAVGLDDDLTGVTGEANTLFVALSRLTADTDTVPLRDTVTVRPTGTGELTVTWNGGPETRVRLESTGVDVTTGDGRVARSPAAGP